MREGYFEEFRDGRWCAKGCLESRPTTSTFWYWSYLGVGFDTGLQDYADARKVVETLYRLGESV
jgi:hypothetical protein